MLVDDAVMATDFSAFDLVVEAIGIRAPPSVSGRAVDGVEIATTLIGAPVDATTSAVWTCMGTGCVQAMLPVTTPTFTLGLSHVDTDASFITLDVNMTVTYAVSGTPTTIYVADTVVVFLAPTVVPVSLQVRRGVTLNRLNPNDPFVLGFLATAADLTYSFVITDETTGGTFTSVMLATMLDVRRHGGVLTEVAFPANFWRPAGRTSLEGSGVDAVTGLSGHHAVRLTTVPRIDAGTYTVSLGSVSVSNVADVEFVISNVNVEGNGAASSLFYEVSLGPTTRRSASPTVSGLRAPPGTYAVTVRVCLGSGVCAASMAEGAPSIIVTGSRAATAENLRSSLDAIERAVFWQ